MTNTFSSHIGRSWAGMGDPLERDCPCPKAACGLVIEDQADRACGQHPPSRAQTMRQRHPADRCPAAPTTA